MNQRQQLLEQIRQQSIQKRAQALREAAQRQATNVPIAAGASSSGGGRAACDPEAGVTLYVTGGGESIIAVQGIYQGLDKNGSPVYDTTIIPGLFAAVIDYDTESSQWRLTVKQGEEELYSYSPSLISQNWTDTLGFITPLYSVCGTLDLEEWCIDIPDFGFGPLKAQALPGWFGIPVTERPNIWLYGLGSYAWIEFGGISAWVVDLEDVGEVGVLGGSQDVLPSTVDIVTGITLTANAGACEY